MPIKHFTVGPTELHCHYRQFYLEALDLNLGSVYHRSATFRKIYQFTDEQLKQLFGLTSTHSIYFTSGGTETWERVLMSLVNENTLHLINGDFGKKFSDVAAKLNKQNANWETTRAQPFNLEKITIPNETELVCITQNETSTGFSLSNEDSNRIRAKAKNSLICSDVVSIAPLSSQHYTIFDTFLFSVQKAFGMPPGLGVWIVNEASKAKSYRMQSAHIPMGAFHTLPEFELNYKKWETPSTPNVIAIYILGKIAEWMNRKGLPTIENEIKEKAKMLYDFAEQSSSFGTLVNSKEHQSNTILVLKTSQPATHIIQKLNNSGFSISAGYGQYQNEEIRIANFPQTTLEETMQLINCLKNTDK